MSREKEYLSRKGIGSGTNLTVNHVAELLSDYHASQLSEAGELTNEELKRFVIKESGYHPNVTFEELGPDQLKKANRLYSILAKFRTEAQKVLAARDVEIMKLNARIEQTLNLLREAAMRCNIAMPEDEQDEEWFDKKCFIENGGGEFMERLFNALDLGNMDKPLPSNNKSKN